MRVRSLRVDRRSDVYDGGMLFTRWHRDLVGGQVNSRSSSSAALDENCGHVPEVKTCGRKIPIALRAQYYPRLHSAFEERAYAAGRGSKIQEIPL